VATMPQRMSAEVVRRAVELCGARGAEDRLGFSENHVDARQKLSPPGHWCTTCETVSFQLGSPDMGCNLCSTVETSGTNVCRPTAGLPRSRGVATCLLKARAGGRAGVASGLSSTAWIHVHLDSLVGTSSGMKMYGGVLHPCVRSARSTCSRCARGLERRNARGVVCLHRPAYRGGRSRRPTTMSIPRTRRLGAAARRPH